MHMLKQQVRLFIMTQFGSIDIRGQEDPEMILTTFVSLLFPSGVYCGFTRSEHLAPLYSNINTPEEGKQLNLLLIWRRSKAVTLEG